MKLRNRRKPVVPKFLLILCVTSMLSACGGSNSTAGPTVKDVALNKITAYAEDGANTAPTLQDYLDAEVSGVTNENLAELNAIVAKLELTDVDTTAEVVALTTELNITIQSRAKWGFNWDDGKVWQ